MLSLGACVVGKEYDDKNFTFYVEIQPISGNYIKEALDVCGLSLEEIRVKGTPPQKAMEKFVNWISNSSTTRKPIFVAYPVAFDWSFVNYYFHSLDGILLVRLE
jgi:ribonuclease T